MDDSERMKWKAEIHRRYPNKVTRFVDLEHEIVAEISLGVAVAVIEKSAPHFHLNAREIYTVLQGRLAVIVEGHVTVLKANLNTAFQISKRTVHQAMGLGEPALVEVFSSPPWSSDDHFLV